MLLQLHSKLYHQSHSFDLCVYTLALCTFWGMMRLGEPIPKDIQSFDGSKHPSISNVSFGFDRSNVEFATITLPWTKTTQRQGAQVILSHQRSKLDPVVFLKQLLAVHKTPTHLPLFSFINDKGSFTTLTKRDALARMNTVWGLSSPAKFTAHSFRIGGTTELLASGIDPIMVKKAGRWTSDSFELYWWNHAEYVTMHVQNAHLRRTLPSSSRTQV